jgi:hypothetical protein
MNERMQERKIERSTKYGWNDIDRANPRHSLKKSIPLPLFPLQIPYVFVWDRTRGPTLTDDDKQSALWNDPPIFKKTFSHTYLHHNRGINASLSNWHVNRLHIMPCTLTIHRTVTNVRHTALKPCGMGNY